MKHRAQDKWNTFQRWRGRRFPKGFEEWYRRSPQRGDELNFRSFPGSDPSRLTQQFAEEVTSPNSRSTHIVVEGQGQKQDFAFAFRAELPDLADTELRTIEAFTITNNTKQCAITGGVIRRLSLHAHESQVRLSNCVVAHLDASNDRRVRLEMTNCWIGTMSIMQASLAKLTVTRGGIADVECPSPAHNNPFVGSVAFSGVFFPVSSKETSLFQGSQGYRNLRAHLEQLDNFLAANQLRAVQFRSERRDERRVESFVNRFYDLCSEYGSNATRPLF